MDHREEQIQEIEALEAIYPGELRVRCREYPNIEIAVKLATHPDPDAATTSEDTSGELTDSEEESEEEEYEGLRCTLTLKFPDNYPEVSPEFDLDGLKDDVPKERLGALMEKLHETIDEGLGMALSFSLVSCLQEELKVIEEEIAEAIEEEAARQIREKEEAERKRLEGTFVTVESFLAWREKFNEEKRAQIKAKKAAELAALGKKLTGREQFLKDATLNLSDLKLIQEQGDEPVKIDESLFEDLDDLDLEDED